MRTATQARGILRDQWTVLFPNTVLSWPAERILLAQSRHEGQWGAFGGYSVWGVYGGENWGAVQAKINPPCPDGTFEAGDSRPSSTGQKPFRWCFVAYDSPEAGARDFLRHALVLRPSAMAPLLAGDVWKYAERLRDTNYYGGFSTTLGEGPEKDARRRYEQIGSYVDAIDKQSAIVDHDLGMPARGPTKKPPFVYAPAKETGAPLWIWILGAAAVGLPVMAGQIWPRRDMLYRR